MPRATGDVYRGAVTLVRDPAPHAPRPEPPRASAPLVGLGAAAAALALGAALGCGTVDPGDELVVADEQFDADFFFCRVEPELLFGKRCGSGEPGVDGANGCHFNAAAVSGMALRDHAPTPCQGDVPTSRAGLGAGSPAQSNLEAASLVMSRDVLTAPLYVRPLGQNHPRAVFTADDPVVDVLRRWADR